MKDSTDKGSSSSRALEVTQYMSSDKLPSLNLTPSRGGSPTCHSMPLPTPTQEGLLAGTRDGKDCLPPQLTYWQPSAHPAQSMTAFTLPEDWFPTKPLFQAT